MKNISKKQMYVIFVEVNRDPAIVVDVDEEVLYDEVRQFADEYGYDLGDVRVAKVGQFGIMPSTRITFIG